MTGIDDPFGIQPARWIIGPPAPRGTAFLARACSLAIMVLVGHWVRVPLHGVGIKPETNGYPDGTNDTSKLFNWHPVLMTLGFVVFMAEALLSYQAPIIPGLPREVRKRIHLGCHLAATVCVFLGFVAVLQSHRLKLPDPMPDWYSPHSFLGLTAIALVGLQVLVGLYSYVWPRLGLSHRMALGPLHRFWGAAAWLAALGAVATGLQEKVTFMQMKTLTRKDLFGPAVRLPAVVLPLLVVLALLVLYHQVPPASKASTPEGFGGSPSPGGSGSSGSAGRMASSRALLKGGRPAGEDEDEEEGEGSGDAEAALGRRRV
ncbi:hypothetical protein VOLCADRAFT_116942 [Volvox carteri f. nagariensis]|uniref:Cytochrome b561 domain-containing protein n=1 Tax=Volvox carteri f. nagariensis TaxID=3068 RepID=D8TQW1_VOLCA|nr:uncharacterized protein VOLCADRAFT_116942 [Volvox carteri f. nagariensis]EFJ50224.1 hypothetical protein VOLCADRAFT_116942 [Volvox carteri f. nagariensis]|eukprot:XP_002948844.1 hypothetical protein VOLCADRAFT_116942 [Volvox carteri f. nagariensis]